MIITMMNPKQIYLLYKLKPISDKVGRSNQRTHTQNQSIVPNPVFWTTRLLAQHKVHFDDRSCEDDRCSIVYYLV
jgi:hypothetical protein